MTRVFAVESSRNDISDAARFGRIVKIQVDRRDTEMSEYSQLCQLLDSFTSEDYFVLSGDHLLVALSTAIISRFTAGQYKLLKWNPRYDRYYPILINEALYNAHKIEAT